ncbi:hypothetical protein [Marinilabilia rubra]|uniref:Uncharacterized protein n=1 Tax=Marinilabilia rubra TaxID=2162893 RepID=A0A2U2B9H3_9BACT|nr:hypothetical protein [Marinilabilia rubra]PWD99718.1 hypothetical protein DDZ16_09755 [Marinilabilia rubra]
MKNISRENYEIWFVDYLDGKLDESSKMEFFVFLETNPDLADELKSFESLELEAEEVSFSTKSQLEKSEADFMEMSSSDYLLVKQMEEGLNDGEEQELATKIKEDESLIKRGKQFQLTRLYSETVSFPAKASLIHRKIGKVYALGIRVASAAAVVLVAVWGYNNFMLQTPDDSLADLKPLKGKSIPSPEPNIGDALKVAESLAMTEDMSSKTMKEFSENQMSFPESDNVKAETGALGTGPEMTLLASRASLTITLPVDMPSAYEAGLRHMMPQYLDIHNRQQALLANQNQKRSPQNDNSLFVKGLKFVDKVSGDLVNFEQLYDEDGNYVAYNLEAGNIKMKQKVKN